MTLSDGQYSVNKNITFENPILKSDLCDYSKAYITVKGTIDPGVVGNNNMTEKSAVFKNNAPFGSCILKINSTFIDNPIDDYY